MTLPPYRRGRRRAPPDRYNGTMTTGADGGSRYIMGSQAAAVSAKATAPRRVKTVDVFMHPIDTGRPQLRTK